MNNLQEQFIDYMVNCQKVANIKRKLEQNQKILDLFENTETDEGLNIWAQTYEYKLRKEIELHELEIKIAQFQLDSLLRD